MCLVSCSRKFQKAYSFAKCYPLFRLGVYVCEVPENKSVDGMKIAETKHPKTVILSTAKRLY